MISIGTTLNITWITTDLIALDKGTLAKQSNDNNKCEP